MNLRNLRNNLALSLEAAARETGTTAATLSRIENGLQVPRPETAEKLALLYGITPHIVLQLVYDAYSARNKKEGVDGAL